MSVEERESVRSQDFSVSDFFFSFSCSKEHERSNSISISRSSQTACIFGVFFPIDFLPGLGLPRPKAIVVIPKNQPLPKHLRKKTSKSAKHACHYDTKERPVKITVYLGLDTIIKIKFTTFLIDVQY